MAPPWFRRCSCRALAKRAGTGRVLWIARAAGRHGGRPMAQAWRLWASIQAVFMVGRRPAADRLWALEEALRTPGLMAAILEAPPAADRRAATAARRLQLAAEQGGGHGFILRQASAHGGLVESRWRSPLVKAPIGGRFGKSNCCARVAIAMASGRCCGITERAPDGGAGNPAGRPSPSARSAARSATRPGARHDGRGHLRRISAAQPLAAYRCCRNAWPASFVGLVTGRARRRLSPLMAVSDARAHPRTAPLSQRSASRDGSPRPPDRVLPPLHPMGRRRPRRRRGGLADVGLWLDITGCAHLCGGEAQPR